MCKCTNNIPFRQRKKMFFNSQRIIYKKIPKICNTANLSNIVYSSSFLERLPCLSRSYGHDIPQTQGYTLGLQRRIFQGYKYQRVMSINTPLFIGIIRRQFFQPSYHPCQTIRITHCLLYVPGIFYEWHNG